MKMSKRKKRTERARGSEQKKGNKVNFVKPALRVDQPSAASVSASSPRSRPPAASWQAARTRTPSPSTSPTASTSSGADSSSGSSAPLVTFPEDSSSFCQFPCETKKRGSFPPSPPSWHSGCLAWWGDDLAPSSSLPSCLASSASSLLS